jgi:hypothetical protein
MYASLWGTLPGFGQESRKRQKYKLLHNMSDDNSPSKIASHLTACKGISFIYKMLQPLGENM